MPEFKNTPGGGPASAGRPRLNVNRTIMMSALAMLVGYFLASRGMWLWQDGSGVVHEFETMNTYARITIPKRSGSPLPPSELAALAEKAVREVNDLMSPFGERSDVKRLNETAAGKWLEVSPLTWRVVMEALRWHRLSGGAFDPTIGPIKRLFVFDRTEADSWPDADALADAQSRSGADKLLFEREGMRLSWRRDGMALDLGAIAKGFAVDRAAEILIANGVKNALIDIGGELRVLGMKPDDPPTSWTTGIRNPRSNDILLKLDLTDCAVATSGDYERFFIYEGKRYEHIIDPRQGLPLSEGIASVTVVHSKSCTAADALATTLSVLGPEEGKNFLEQQALGAVNVETRVVMISVEPEGALRKYDFRINGKGEVLLEEELIER